MDRSYLNQFFQLSIEKKYSELSNRLFENSKLKSITGIEVLVKEMDVTTHTILFSHLSTLCNISDIYSNVDYFLKVFDSRQFIFCPAKIYEIAESFIKHLDANKILIKGIKALEVSKKKKKKNQLFFYERVALNAE